MSSVMQKPLSIYYLSRRKLIAYGLFKLWFLNLSFVFKLSRHMRSSCCVSLPTQLSNAWTNLYETWYVRHDTWVHLNCVFPESLPSVCVSVYVSTLSLQGDCLVGTLPLQRIHTQQWNNGGARHFLWGPCHIKEAIRFSQNFLLAYCTYFERKNESVLVFCRFPQPPLLPLSVIDAFLRNWVPSWNC
jgi:hypothetical protein